MYIVRSKQVRHAYAYISRDMLAVTAGDTYTLHAWHWCSSTIMQMLLELISNPTHTNINRMRHGDTIHMLFSSTVQGGPTAVPLLTNTNWRHI